MNRAVVQSIGDMAIENAIVRQQTLYPYHFILDSAELNELGQKELSVLAAHYREYPGTLRVHRGDTAAALYTARITRVREELQSCGVDPARMVINDAMPGGDGMWSEKVFQITKGRNSPSRPPYFSETGSPLREGTTGGAGAGTAGGTGAGAAGAGMSTGQQ